MIYLGGVLGLINATAMAVGAARDGQPIRIALLDEGKAGNAHREWNISLAELAEIVRAGVATWDDLAGIVANRYRAGIVRFHAETIDVPAAPVTTEEVLDVAVRADALLAHCRRRFTACGGVIHEGRRFRRCDQRTRGRAGSVIEVEGPGGLERYGARLVVDAMGTISPVAWAINQGERRRASARPPGRPRAASGAAATRAPWTQRRARCSSPSPTCRRGGN